jgi:hypothetical protein
MTEALAIQPRFRGPPDSGHGGYTCGLLAAHVRGRAVVSLLRPPPLGRSLSLEIAADGVVTLHDGDELIAEARPAEAALDVEVPAPVSPAEAREASDAYPGRSEHPFPSCFGCGPAREVGDGLRLFPGRVAGRDLVAAPWTPALSVAGDLGHVRDEIVWAALDCPTGWSFHGHPELPAGSVSLLARMEAVVDGAVLASEAYVVMAWPVSIDGRKRLAASAIVDEAGMVRARGRALWIELA